MRTQIPRLANGPVDLPRTSIGVERYGRDQLTVGFRGGLSGFIEIVSLAEAEALAERLLDWVDYVRYEQLVSRVSPE